MTRRFPVLLIVLLLFSALFSITAPAQAAEKKAKERLAVLDLDAKFGVEKGFAEALSVIIRDKLHSYGQYQVMSTEDIQSVASREQLKQAIGCDDSAGQCLVDFGRKIDSRFMVAGDISKLGSTYTISLRMLDTKGDGAGVINRVSESCKCADDALIGTVQDVAAKLVGKPASSATKAEEEKKTENNRAPNSPHLANKLIGDKLKSDRTNAGSTLSKAQPDPSPNGTQPYSSTVTNLSGLWDGRWTNSSGESGADSLEINEDENGNLVGLWSGTIPVTGKQIEQSTYELIGRTAKREYQVKAVLRNGELYLDYIALKLNATGSYSGKSILYNRVRNNGAK